MALNYRGCLHLKHIITEKWKTKKRRQERQPYKICKSVLQGSIADEAGTGSIPKAKEMRRRAKCPNMPENKIDGSSEAKARTKDQSSVTE